MGVCPLCCCFDGFEFFAKYFQKKIAFVMSIVALHEICDCVGNCMGLEKLQKWGKCWGWEELD